MLPNSFVLKLVLLIVSVILLSQCTKVAENQNTPSRSNKQSTIPYPMPASAYLALAKNQGGDEQQNLLLMAAGRFIYDGQWREGIRTLTQTNNLSPEQTSEKIYYSPKHI